MSNATGSAYRIVVCTYFRWTKRSEKRRHIVIRQIKRFLELTDNCIRSTFGVREEACLVGCENPCTAAFLGQSKTNYLFSGIQTIAGIAAIDTYFDRYYRSDSGWTQSQECAEALRGKMLARFPGLTTIPETRGGGSP